MHRGHEASIKTISYKEVKDMAKRPVCEAPRCTVENGLRVCPVVTAVWGEGCRERRRDEFHPASIFWKPTGKSMILIGCLRESWDAQAGKCKRGTKGIMTITAV